MPDPSSSAKVTPRAGLHVSIAAAARPRRPLRMKRTALTAWFVAAAVLVAANTYVCYVNVRRLIGSTDAVTRSRQIIMATNAVVASLLDAETASAGT